MLDVAALDRIWNDLDPRRRVPPEDEQHWYADLSAGRGRTDFAGRLSKAIQRARTPVRFAILGHLGSGKSTELARLKRLLTDADRGRWQVLELLVDQDLDREDVDGADIQLLLLERLLDAILARGGALSRETVRRVAVWLPEQEEGSAPSLGALRDAVSVLRKDVQISVERRGLLRRRTQQELRARLDVLAELALLLVEVVRADAPGGVALLVDGVEKVALLPDGRERARSILLDQAEQWDHIGLPMVFSAPLSLLAEDRRLSHAFTDLYIIPALPVSPREAGLPVTAEPAPRAELPSYVSDARGSLDDLLRRRVPELDQLFSDEEVRQDCLVRSGGSIRDLFRLIREGIEQVQDRSLKGGSIGAEDLSEAWRRHASKVVVALQDADLERIRRLKWDQGDFVYDAVGVSLLQRELVLPYENGGRWFAVHPALRERLSK